ncbi:MAG: divergent polysaccharide deacetylase family protein [Proteobacteria bacterium]|nr:divergent polysaccharide deacetylase family protein [Pseudomonadota bacterium]
MIGRWRLGELLTPIVLPALVLCGGLGCERAPRPAAPGSRPGGAGAAERCHRARPCLAIVIDDLGRALAPLHQLLALPLALTFAVLPHARQTAASVVLLRTARRELWLHLPLEPQQPSAVSDEPVVLGRGDRVAPVLADALSRVPGAVGVNSHMGSAFSADPDAAGRLMVALSRYGLPFLDSRTTSRSVLCSVARRVGTPCLQRDVFLDDARDLVTVRERLGAALALAQRRGWAVAVGHPQPTTVEALRGWARPDHGGVRVVPLSVVVEGARQGAP